MSFILNGTLPGFTLKLMVALTEFTYNSTLTEVSVSESHSIGAKNVMLKFLWALLEIPLSIGKSVKKFLFTLTLLICIYSSTV